MLFPKFSGEDWIVIQRFSETVDKYIGTKDLHQGDIVDLMSSCTLGAAKTWWQHIRHDREVYGLKSDWLNCDFWAVVEGEGPPLKRLTAEELADLAANVIEAEEQFVPTVQGQEETEQQATAREARNVPIRDRNRPKQEVRAPIEAKQQKFTKEHQERTAKKFKSLNAALEERFCKRTQVSPREAREQREKGIAQKPQEAFVSYVERRTSAWYQYMQQTEKDWEKQRKAETLRESHKMKEIYDMLAEEVLHNCNQELRRYLQERPYDRQDEEKQGEERLNLYVKTADKWETTDNGKKWLRTRQVATVSAKDGEKEVMAVSAADKKKNRQNQKNKNKNKNKAKSDGNKSEDKPKNVECTYCGLKNHPREECKIEPRERDQGWQGPRARNYPVVSRFEKERRQKAEEAKVHQVQTDEQRNSQTAAALRSDGQQSGQLMLYDQPRAVQQIERSAVIGRSQEQMLPIVDQSGSFTLMAESEVVPAIRNGNLFCHIPKPPNAPPSLFNVQEHQM